MIVYVGPSDCCAPLPDEVEGALGDAAEVYLVARLEVWALVTLRYRAVDERPMLRWSLTPACRLRRRTAV